MHPVLFRFGSFYIGTYGLMLALALILGTLVALRRARQVGVPTELVLDLIFLAVLGGIIGGRVAHVIVYWEEFTQAPFAVLFGRTGFVFIGSLLGAILLVTVKISRSGVAFWEVVDVLVTPVPLGHVFGRIGCFLAGCCYGRVVDESGSLGFLAVQFPRGHRVGDQIVGGQAFWEHVTRRGLDPQAACSLPVWPVQLFEAAGNLLIFAALMWLWRRRRFSGQVFFAYLLLYPVLRFSLEFLRGDSGRGTIVGLSTSQFLSLLVFAGSLAAYRILSRRAKKGLPRDKGSSISQ